MSDAVAQLLVALGILIVLGLGMWAITELAWQAQDRDRKVRCTFCRKAIHGTPYRVPNQEFWVGLQADPYCGPVCASAEAEERAAS